MSIGWGEGPEEVLILQLREAEFKSPYKQKLSESSPGLIGQSELVTPDSP